MTTLSSKKKQVPTLFSVFLPSLSISFYFRSLLWFNITWLAKQTEKFCFLPSVICQRSVWPICWIPSANICRHVLVYSNRCIRDSWLKRVVPISATVKALGTSAYDAFSGKRRWLDFSVLIKNTFPVHSIYQKECGLKTVHVCWWTK